MKVLQLIDTLRAGGAERVSVNIANELVGRIEKSYLCSTREEGPLKDELNSDVEYLYLMRKQTLDFSAFRKLKQFILYNKIDVIHAHASSFFIATIIRIQLPNVKLIWHDHLGKRIATNLKPWSILKLCSNYFDYVICVNNELLDWAKINLNVSNLSYMANFIVAGQKSNGLKLQGKKDKRILYLANLRSPKNHILLLKAFSFLIKDYPDWTLHLVGKDYYDDYSNELKTFISSKSLDSFVYILGQQNNISSIIDQCSIGVISSTSEGLPLALLEYGLGGLSVISSDVGQCKDVISDFGLVVAPNSLEELKNALRSLIINENLRRNFSHLFQNHVISNYGPKSFIDKLDLIYRKTIKRG